MDRPPLCVSPVAAFLVGLAERRDTGRMLLGDRSLVVSAGDLAQVSGAPQDYHFHEYLMRVGQLTREQCAHIEQRAHAQHSDFYRTLLTSELLPAAEVRSQRRALWLERLVRALREHMETPVGADTWSAGTDALEPTDDATPSDRARLLPLLLDALARNTQSAETQRLQSSVDLCWVWTPRSASADAKQWASLGELPDGATLSTLFAKRPRCAPQLAALLRAGLASLENAASGTRADARPAGADAAAFAASLAPPPSRLTRAPVAAWSQHPPAPLQTTPTPQRQGHVNLDPGGSGSSIDEIPLVELTTWPRRLGPVHDPLREIELKLDECTEPERRAELFSVLADLWDQRIGSLEEAARNYREAAAALPHEARLLLQAARACWRVGHGALAQRYVLAALPECRAKELRFEALQLLATLQQRQADAGALSTLKRAAAENASLAWPHERLAQVYQARASWQLAAAQLRAAGKAERERAPQRALANYAQAYSWHPKDDALAADYADALAGLGQPETAIAILEHTARHAAPDVRQRLLRDAAQRAQHSGRQDLAAEHWLALWVEQPSSHELMSQLDTALARPGLEAERAVILEAYAAIAPADQEHWKTRAAEALARVPTRQTRPTHGAAPDDALALARQWRTAIAQQDAASSATALRLLSRARTGRERGRSLAQLASQLERLQDLDGALEHAEAALVEDPTAADAALIALRHVDRRAPEQALQLLARVQRLLGSSPAVLMASAEANARAGALDAQRRALSELIRRGPNLTPPRVLWLRSWLSSSDATGIERAAHELMTHVHAAYAEVDAHIKAAVERLAQLGASAAAAQLAERLLANTAQLDPTYADYAYELACQSGKSTLALRALERAASAHTGSGRADRLLQIAGRHAAAADRAAELRALLRAAAVPEGRERALETLTSRYAEVGDVQRVLTVLSLRLDATKDVPARRQLLVAMASAAVSLADDRIRASGFVERLLRENTGDRAGLLLGIGALFALGSSDWAFQTARKLLARIDPTSAGACYLWLAHRAEGHAGAASLALELALEGAQRYQVEGELLLMAERLTLAQSDKPGILTLYAALIDQACGCHGLRALHYRAGRWLERFGAHGEALEHYQRAFELAPRAGAISAALKRCKQLVGNADHAGEIPRADTAPPAAAPTDGRAETTREDELHERIRSGDVAALEELVERLRADDEREEETLAMLTRLVRATPQRSDALRDLQERSLRAGAIAQARICDQIASLFDVRFPAHPRVVFAPAELPPEELWQVVCADRAPGLSRLMALLWQHVQELPQLLPTIEPETLGTAWNEAAPVGEIPLASAYERVLAALGRDAVHVYLRPNLAPEVSAMPTPDVVLLVRAGLTQEAALEFQLAHALVACEPEHALVTALQERAARRVLNTVKATFGPEGHATELSRVDPKLGALLRARLSDDEQLELQTLVAAHAHALDYHALQREAERCAVRAGVLVSGDIRASLEALARTDPSLSGCNIQSEQGFAQACAASSAFAEALRTALSLPFVGCTELALEAAAEAL